MRKVIAIGRVFCHIVILLLVVSLAWGINGIQKIVGQGDDDNDTDTSPFGSVANADNPGGGGGEGPPPGY